MMRSRFTNRLRPAWKQSTDDLIGRGQRQLIIDRQTKGKTQIAGRNHEPACELESGDPNKQVRRVYVAVGQKGSTIAAVRSLEEAGAMEHTTIIATPASDPAGYKAWPRTPARQSASTGCTRASTSSSYLTTCRSRRKHTARYRSSPSSAGP